MNEQEYLVQKIRTQYTEREYTALDALKKLDRTVKRPAQIFAYVFGSVAAIIMGSGMSFVMTDIGSTVGVAEPLISGIIIGVAGMAMAIANYPMYKALLGSRRKKFADEIISLSDTIMKNSDN